MKKALMVDLSVFTLGVSVIVYNEEGKAVFNKNVPAFNFQETVTELAKEYNSEKILLFGNEKMASKFKEEIETYSKIPTSFIKA